MGAGNRWQQLRQSVGPGPGPGCATTLEEPGTATMPRTLKEEEEQRFLGWAQELGRVFRSLQHASIPEKVQAYKQAEKRILKETRTAYEKQEMQRRVAEFLLMELRFGPWRVFSPHLRRLERLGYTTMIERLYACSWAAHACQGSPAGVRKTAALIADIERRLRGRKLHPELQEQFDTALARARSLAGLPPKPSKVAVSGRSPRTASGRRRRADH